MFYIDPFYLVIFVLTLIISITAQIFVSSTYRKWSKVRNSTGLTGEKVGDQIVRRTGLGTGGYFPSSAAAPSYGARSGEMKKLDELHRKGIISNQEYDEKLKQIQLEVGNQQSSISTIRFAQVPGELTDSYDPRTHTVRMSREVATTPSVASMAIVAHELGHAQQHEKNSILIQMRNILVPAIRFSPQIAYICIFLGLIFNFAGLIYLGALFYGLMVVFTLVTLPVEIDASRRGLKLLNQSGLMQTNSDKTGSRSMLTAAAMTYVAAAITAILQFIYYISLGRRRS